MPGVSVRAPSDSCTVHGAGGRHSRAVKHPGDHESPVDAEMKQQRRRCVPRRPPANPGGTGSFHRVAGRRTRVRTKKKRKALGLLRRRTKTRTHRGFSRVRRSSANEAHINPQTWEARARPKPRQSRVWKPTRKILPSRSQAVSGSETYPKDTPSTTDQGAVRNDEGVHGCQVFCSLPFFFVQGTKKKMRHRVHSEEVCMSTH